MTHVIEIDTLTWLLFAGGAVAYFALFDLLGYSVEVSGGRPNPPHLTSHPPPTRMDGPLDGWWGSMG